jgi:hypothetical protein
MLNRREEPSKRSVRPVRRNCSAPDAGYERTLLLEVDRVLFRYHNGRLSPNHTMYGTGEDEG